jgi:cell division protein FtsA
MNEAAVGIDIGSSKVCTIIGELNKNSQLQIMGVGTAECRGYRKGIIVDIDNTSQAITNSVEQAERMSGMEVKAAYISMPGGLASLVKNRGVIAIPRDEKEITNDDVKRVLASAAAENIPVDMEVIGVIPLQFIVDGYENIKDPVGMMGLRLEVEANIITAPLSAVQNLVKSIERCNIDVLGIVIQPIADAEALLTKDEKDLGIALIDVGSEITNISVFTNGQLSFTKLIPIGGAHITNDISIGLKIPVSEAEKLKRQYGCALVSMIKTVEDISVNIQGTNSAKIVSNKVLTDIIEARVQEIYYLVNRELEQSGFKKLATCGAVLSGGGLSFINGAAEAGASLLGMPVRIGSPKYIGVASPVYSTATGMVKHILSSKKYGVSKNYSGDEQESASVSRTRKQSLGKSNSVIGRIKEFFEEFF